MKQEGNEDMTAQEEAWIAGRLFINDAQRSRFLAFRSGGRLGLISVLKQQSENLFPGQPTPMSIDATNTTRKIDSSILAVLKDSSDKQIEAMILDPAPKGTSTNQKDRLPTAINDNYSSTPNSYGIYGICLRTRGGESLCLSDLMKVFKELEAYHAGLVLDPDRNVMIRPSQTTAEAQKFQKIDEQIGGCHYVETSLLRDSTRRYCTTQEHMTEYQDLAKKWREIYTTLSAKISRAPNFRSKISAPLFTDIGASKAVKDVARQHSDGEMSRLVGLVSAIAQTLGEHHDGFQARTYLLALLSDAKLVPMAEHVVALLVGAYHGHGGVKKYAAGDFTNLEVESSSNERPGRLARLGYYTAIDNNHNTGPHQPESHEVQIKVEQDMVITTAYPEIHEEATAIMNQLNLKRKSFTEQEESLAVAKKKLKSWEKKNAEIEKQMKNETNASNLATEVAEKRHKKLKLTAEKIAMLTKMALVSDKDVVKP